MNKYRATVGCLDEGEAEHLQDIAGYFVFEPECWRDHRLADEFWDYKDGADNLVIDEFGEDDPKFSFCFAEMLKGNAQLLKGGMNE
jgi:hypothetical protein